RIDLERLGQLRDVQTHAYRGFVDLAPIQHVGIRQKTGPQAAHQGQRIVERVEILVKRALGQTILSGQGVIREPNVLLEFEDRFVPQIQRVPARSDEFEFHNEMQRQALVERVLQRVCQLDLEIRLE